MIAGLLARLFASQLSRWVTVGVVTVLLSGAGLWWYNKKQELREEGANECVQIINQATHQQLVEENARNAIKYNQLRNKLRAMEKATLDAHKRARLAEDKLLSFRSQAEKEREDNEEYREWADTPLPGGVADRLRELQAGSD